MFNFSYTRFIFFFGLILLGIFSATTTACSHTEKKISFYPIECLYPDSNFVNGKTFIYRNIKDTNDIRFGDCKIVTEGRKDYLLTRQYTQNITIDSVKYTLDWQPIESYIFMPDSPLVYRVKGVTVQNEIVDDGSRLGRRISITDFNAYDYILTIRNEEYFLKDTIINWKGSELDCIKTRSTTWIKLHNKRDSSATENSERVSEGYFAKGIGLIRYTGNSQGKSVTMELSEIRDMRAEK